MIAIKYLSNKLFGQEATVMLQFCCNIGRNMKKAPRFHEAP
jgi:hypothetical protein